MTPSGEWAPVAVSPPGTDNDPSPPILVNIGDLLSHWTNGLLKSTVHRVIFPKDAKRGGDDRYSIAFFCHPVGTTILEAIPSNMVKGHGMEVASDASSITADEHLMSRLKATYLSINFEKENEKGGN
jgi:isopenicillin N synthase-like dioxygenase